MEKILVTSTYELNVEKEKILTQIIDNRNLPIDLFVLESSKQDTFPLIKKVVQNIDSIILIVGGIYGAINSTTKKSYSESIYDYAKEINKPIKIFIRTPFEIIPPNKIDVNTANIQKFREKLLKNNNIIKWNYIEDIEVKNGRKHS